MERDAVLRDRASRAFERVALEVHAPPPQKDWFEQAASLQPDCLWLDGDLAGAVAAGTLLKLRQQAGSAGMRILIASEDPSPNGRAAAYRAGADEFIAKPYSERDVLDALDCMDRFVLRFWGIRGTLPVPGRGTVRYGGNTSCISLSIGCDREFAFDAGTGLRSYSEHLQATVDGRFNGHLFITHPHWDHLNCLPFFAPFYRAGNRVQLHGPAQGSRSLRNLIDQQMDGVFFPITASEFKADVSYEDLSEGRYRFDGVDVRAKRLQHPGECLAYRLEYGARSVAYVTDNELGLPGSGQPVRLPPPELTDYLRDADVLIHDTTYFDDEYPVKLNWGHSSVGQVTELAHAAGVKHFFLFHHDPSHDDDAIDRKLAVARERLHRLASQTQCHIASEGLEIDIASL